MNRKAFYDVLRRRDSGVFGTRLSEDQVRGIEGLLDAFVTHGDGRAKTLAYGLATVVRETGSRMVPVREGFAKTDASARRIVRNRKYGKPAGPYNEVYYGRGHVQLTWYDNYVKSSADAGVDLARHPDGMLNPEISARVLWRGLLDGRWNGRGKGVAYYLPNDGPDDLKNARRTVNITDHWQEIAGYYRAFMRAIEAAGGAPTPGKVPQTPSPPDVEPTPSAPAPVPARGIIEAFLAILKAIFGDRSS